MEAVVDEDAEPVAAAKLALALSGVAPGRESAAILGRIGLAGQGPRLPLREPLTAAPPHLPPLLEVVGRQRPQHDPAAVQLDRQSRCGSPGHDAFLTASMVEGSSKAERS